MRDHPLNTAGSRPNGVILVHAAFDLHHVVRASTRRVFAKVQVVFSKTADVEKARAMVKGAGNPGDANDLAFNK
ncbi:hypothetical protein HDU89_004678 [Geranomyces variabilis]|nr:hypothetical protein HDU89_004678 [Geranomyces variabilis]